MNYQTADNLINNFNQVTPLATITAVLLASDQDTMWEHSFPNDTSIIWNGTELEFSDEDDNRYPIKPTTALEQSLDSATKGFYTYRVW